ncbi:MAG: hypothetical protein EOP04_28735 [Proteobacteria bacterium]|nr:MAG: hypothetical protein EOP04_28735 [Pseudomonadota bacterium]
METKLLTPTPLALACIYLMFAVGFIGFACGLVWYIVALFFKDQKKLNARLLMLSRICAAVCLVLMVASYLLTKGS